MVCRSCDSAFTLRIGRSTALVEIGAQESYRTVCRQCYAFGPFFGAGCGPAP
jgi:thymidine kinase